MPVPYFKKMYSLPPNKLHFFLMIFPIYGHHSFLIIYCSVDGDVRNSTAFSIIFALLVDEFRAELLPLGYFV